MTGASSGIGRAIAGALAEAGFRVIAAARREEKLADLAEKTAEVGGEVTPHGCDVADSHSVDMLFDMALERFGALDLLVNNAGTLALHPMDEMPVDEFDRVMATNLRGPFLCSRRALQTMKIRGVGGRIINVESLSAMRVRAGNSAYNASKFGLEGLTHSMALEGRPHGISCSIIHPGTTRSEITNYPDFPEPLIEAADIARAVTLMATMPPNVNFFEAVIHPTTQEFIGRG